MTNFLQKELLADQYANLEQAGHVAEDRIPLARVFVDLPTFDERRLEPPDEKSAPEELPPGFIADVLNVAAERLDPESLRGHAGHQSATREVSRPEPGRFVIIGGPGQGKTTIGQFICQLFRTAILKKRPQHLFPSEVRQALQLGEAQCHSAGIQLPSAPRFPIRIALSDLAAKLASKEATQINSLLSYMVDRIRRRTDREISPDDFRRWLGGYPWIIILDGLDEVPASSNRDEVLAAVRDFWIDATECNADVLVVATTRPQGYNEEYAPNIYQHKWLAPLSTVRAMHYGRRLTEVRYGNDPDRYDKIVTRLQRASSHEATGRLMRSPLQVTIMTTLVDRMGQPPQERWNLFKEYYNVIYQREVERDIPAATVLREYKPDIDAIHNRVGLLVQVESERSGQTEARLSSDCFADLVEGRLIEEGHEGEDLSDLKQRIIEAATHRLVFLVGLEADEIGFEIRSLQEFMAAEGLMEGRDEVVRKRLREIAPIVNWRNVFLFAAGKCFAERQHLRDTIYTICSELNENTEDEVAPATLAGSQLALDLLEDGPARRQPKYAQGLARLALRLLDLPQDSYQIRLADLYEPGLEHVYREEVERRLIQSDPEHRLGAWASLITLVESKVPWAESLMNTHWPSAESEQLQLLRVAAQHRDGSWVISRLVNALPRLSPFVLRPLFSRFHLLTTSRSYVQKPAWLDALIAATYRRYETSHPVPVRLPDVETRDILELTPVMIGQIRDWWIPFKELPKPCSDWIPFVAASRFLENPSHATLAHELRTIAQDCSLPWTDEIAELVPWPIGACLRVASNPNELWEMADRAEAGDFGTVEDWIEAENRWLRQGVVVEDIDSMTDERWPFDRGIAELGFPFALVFSSVHLVSERSAFARGLLDMHARYDESYIRSTISRWILRLLASIDLSGFQIPGNEGFLGKVTCSQFRTIVQDATPYRIQTNALAALTWEDTLDQEWVDFFDYLGKQERLIEPRGTRTQLLSRPLSDALREHPTRVGILRVLSLLARQGARSSIPVQLLDPELYDDPMFREAAIIVRLTQGDWSQDEAKSLAEFTAELVKDRPGIGNLALRIISEHRVTGPFVDRFLLELCKRLPATEWKTISQTIRALNDSVGRRTSRLGDPHVWSMLGLPEGLHYLVRE